ncbi:MAG: hypothetical protein NC390_04955 [Fusobacterium sp.]|nr:hypothetical protein [Fusobacterium sp.]
MLVSSIVGFSFGRPTSTQNSQNTSAQSQPAQHNCHCPKGQKSTPNNQQQKLSILA